MAEDDANNLHLQEINQEIYKRNLELAVVNKTLSLLRKLYQISLLALDPASLSEKISNTVQEDLNMEMVGIFLYHAKEDILQPFQFAKTDRLVVALKELAITIDMQPLGKVSTIPLLKQIVQDKTFAITTKLNEVWGIKLDAEKFESLAQKSHVKTAMLYPLTTQDKVIGMLCLGLNRSYDALSDFEQDSIHSFIDVVAVALDKALLYEELRVANEQLQALDKARAEFISIASHQLRTPPATIKWYLGAVLNGDFGELNQELKAALQRTNVTNDAQISTIDDLLNASRIERGKLEFFFEKGAMEPVVSSLVDQLQPLAQMKKQVIEYVKPSAPLPDILMDKEKVRQVINNMIDNAIKYSKIGTIKVVLTKDGESVIVKITDTGKGIAAKELEGIFEKYTRGHDSVTHATGLGLGMYVAKIVVEQHNGKIWAESDGVGKGATFAFSLPIESNLKPTAVDLAL